MTKSRKQRIDSLGGKTEIVQRALQNVIKPPAYIQMNEDDLRFFNNVTKEYARSEWSEHQLEIACFLAKAMADLERETNLMRQEGFIVVNEKGWAQPNQRQSGIRMAAGTVLNLRRSLMIHARAKTPLNTPLSKVAAGREMVRAIENEALSGTDADDGLLATPASYN